MPERDFLWFLDRSLRILAEEAPEALRRMLEEGRDLRLRIDAPAARATAWISPRGVEIYEAPGEIDVFISFDERVIVELAEGEISLNDALLEDRLELRGPVESLERLHAAMTCYIKGAARSPGLSRLLADYRDAIAD